MGTVGELSKPRGNRTFLPQGTNNYRLLGVREEVHAYFLTRQAVLDVELNGERYNVELALEAGPQGNAEAFADRNYRTMVGFGLKPSVIAAMEAANQDVSNVQTDPAWANELAAALPGFVGSVLELHVIHKDSKKLKDDGTPFKNANTYVNKVVSSPAETPTAVAAGSTYAGDDDIPF